jgi:hypothetical protein
VREDILCHLQILWFDTDFCEMYITNWHFTIDVVDSSSIFLPISKIKFLESLHTFNLKFWNLSEILSFNDQQVISIPNKNYFVLYAENFRISETTFNQICSKLNLVP